MIKAFETGVPMTADAREARIEVGPTQAAIESMRAASAALGRVVLEARLQPAAPERATDEHPGVMGWPATPEVGGWLTAPRPNELPVGGFSEPGTPARVLAGPVGLPDLASGVAVPPVTVGGGMRQNPPENQLPGRGAENAGSAFADATGSQIWQGSAPIDAPTRYPAEHVVVRDTVAPALASVNNVAASGGFDAAMPTPWAYEGRAQPQSAAGSVSLGARDAPAPGMTTGLRGPGDNAPQEARGDMLGGVAAAADLGAGSGLAAAMAAALPSVPEMAVASPLAHAMPGSSPQVGAPSGAGSIGRGVGVSEVVSHLATLIAAQPEFAGGRAPQLSHQLDQPPAERQSARERWGGMVPPSDQGGPAGASDKSRPGPVKHAAAVASEGAGPSPVVVHTEVHLDGQVLARAVTERIVAGLNGPLAGAGGFDPRRSYTPVEG